MKALVGASNHEKALVGAFSVIVKTGCGTDGSICGTIYDNITAGRLCEKCDGKCVICDSYVRPCTLVRICDECNYGSYQVRPLCSWQELANDQLVLARLTLGLLA